MDLDTLSSYLPHPIATRILEAPERPLLGWSDWFEAAVLFADISDFTPLSEALGLVGPHGTEELTHILNDTFTPLIEHTHHWGGVVGKFAGDAFTALFSGSDSLLRALSCALGLRHYVLAHTVRHTRAGDFAIGMKFGLAAGRVLATTVGTERRAEFVFAGPPLVDAGAAQNLASSGEVVLHPTILRRLPTGAADLQPIPGDHAVLHNLHLQVPPSPLPPLPPCPNPDAAARAFRPFLPQPVYEQLDAGSAAFVNEHRRVTALFVRFDGIDYGTPNGAALLNRYSQQAIEVANRFGGYMRQILVGEKGSQAVILFGAPITHENNEERALLCALALQEHAAEMNWIVEQHIGVNTGRVFVGNVGSARRREYTAIGDGINLAARLMQNGPPNSVLVGETTYQATHRRFAFQPAIRIKVKGKAQAITTHSLIGKAPSSSIRLQEPHYKLPMVGRRQELARLEKLLIQVAQSGHGQTVGITAEAGMGKSRLAAEVISRALDLGFRGMGGNGLSHGTTTPYLVWRPILRGLLELDDRPFTAQIETVSDYLSAIHPDLAGRLPLLGDVLGLDIPDNELTATFDARLRRESLSALIIDLIRHQAASAPLLLVLEDAHWLDDLSRDLARAVGRVIGTAPENMPVLFLTVYRPPEIKQQAELWATPPPAFTEFRLGPFSHDETAELVRLKLTGQALPADIVKQVEARAQGNPFFIDEFLNLVQDRGIDLDDPAALASLEVPDSLQSLIVSRVDQLNESEKMTIRVASVIGRLFRARWLLAIYPGEMREELLRSQLAHLDGVELVLLDQPDPELEYLFKHAITHEVIYQTLSFANRRMLHARVAAHIEENYAGALEAWYGILAYHYRQAEQAGKEFEYTRLAAEQAAHQYAARQAVTSYGRAIELGEQHNLCTSEALFDMYVAHYEQNSILGEDKRMLKDAERLMELAAELDPHQQAVARIKMGNALWHVGRLAEAVALYEQAAELARQHDDSMALAEALKYRGYVHFGTGEYEQAKAMLLQVIEMAGPEDWRQESSALQVMGWILYDEGDLDQAEQSWRRALELKQTHGDRPGEVLLLSNLGVVHLTRNEIEKGIEYNERSLALATQIGYRTGEMESRIRLGEAGLQVGQYEYARRGLDNGLAISNQFASDVWGQSYIRSRIVEILLETGENPQEADRLSREAVEIARPEGGKELLGWILHTRGRVLMQQGKAKEAKPLLEESAELRRQVGQMVTCAASLGDLGLLHLQQGNLEAAHACVDEILALLFPPEGKGAEGTESIAAGLACYRILHATGDGERARELLQHAHDTLQQYASHIETEDLRRSYLERVSVNRDVIAAYRAEFGAAG